jgi:competence protein ComEC
MNQTELLTCLPGPEAAPQPSARLRDSARLNALSSPLFLAVVLWTSGIVLDRYFEIAFLFSLLLVIISLAGWLLNWLGRAGSGGLIYLLVCCAGLGATYHGMRQRSYPADDIGTFATTVAGPIQARGWLDEEPVSIRSGTDPELHSIEPETSTSCVLRLEAIQCESDWVTSSGRAQLSVQGQLSGLHAGDEVEVFGRLLAPEAPGNPGELDYRSFLRDQRIRAIIRVVKTTAGVTRLERGSLHTPAAWLARIRAWGRHAFQTYISAHESGLASALLLGESTAMTSADWEKYQRTGVIHVLAISGLHLAVLGAFLWWTLPLLHISRRRATWAVTFLLVFYAVLAGARPPILRSAVTVLVLCIGYYLRRPVMLGNSLALAWLAVSLVNPAYLATSGCQLSFLAIVIIYWGLSHWPVGQKDPLEKLFEESLPRCQRHVRNSAALILAAYLVTFPIWLVAAPLVAAHHHLISPIGLLIGPPLIVLGSMALMFGFLLLLAAPIFSPLALILGWLTGKCLALCELVVNVTGNLPGAYWYVANVPAWWLWCFYLGLFACLTIKYFRARWQYAILAGLAWGCVGLFAGTVRLPSDEMRCTFLAVGHGGCTVIETADGRTLLYDAGAMTGPDVTRRQIAPFLWERGIRRIDEILLSHADLDHFNGLPALLERFSIGQVTCTPTFSSKQTPGVGRTLQALSAWHIPVRIVHAGHQLRTGLLEMQILHPPPTGPEGNENARSMVVLLRHLGHTILLTGDLEGSGLGQVLSLPAPPVDVLMAPHHGSAVSNRTELALWAHPRIVVSCEGQPRALQRGPEPYTATGATFLSTWLHGAVTIRSHPTGMVVQTFRSQKSFVAHRGAEWRG